MMGSKAASKPASALCRRARKDLPYTAGVPSSPTTRRYLTSGDQQKPASQQNRLLCRIAEGIIAQEFAAIFKKK